MCVDCSYAASTRVVAHITPWIFQYCHGPNVDGDLSPERADRFLARLFWKVRWLIHLPSSLNAIISHSVPSNELSSSARIPTKYDVVPTTIDTTCRRREFAHNPSSVCVDSSLRVCNFPQHGESNTAAVHARRVSVCMGAHPWRVRQCILLSVCSLLLHVLLRATCSLSRRRHLNCRNLAGNSELGCVPKVPSSE